MEDNGQVETVDLPTGRLWSGWAIVANPTVPKIWG